MRFVNRSDVSEPDSLSAADGAAARELARATAHFHNTPDEAFTFSAYKSDDVADALNQLFRGKCAYCESSIQAVQPTDIEHFRPKGRVAECADHPGYWWLAASWSNLLASCIDCNRQRYNDVHQLADDRFTLDPDWRFNLGKGDCFPILGLSHARCPTDDHGAEDAALIDPTRREPSDHLAWREENSLSVVGPKMQAGGHDLYGWHTYRVFGLNRQGLVEQRTARLREIRAQIVFVEQMLDMSMKLPEPLATQQQDLVFAQFAALYQLADAGQPYSAMVKSMLDEEFDRLDSKYRTLTI